MVSNRPSFRVKRFHFRPFSTLLFLGFLGSAGVDENGEFSLQSSELKGDFLVLRVSSRNGISARTFMDRLTNVPDLVENAKRAQCPVLFIRGDKEPADNYPAEAFKQNCPSSCEVVIVPDCDHFYVGAEDRVATIVSDWLSRTLD